jgi:hypothetical protein
VNMIFWFLIGAIIFLVTFWLMQPRRTQGTSTSDVTPSLKDINDVLFPGLDHIQQQHQQMLENREALRAQGMSEQDIHEQHMAVIGGMMDGLFSTTDSMLDQRYEALGAPRTKEISRSPIAGMTMKHVKRLIAMGGYPDAKRDFWANFDTINKLLRTHKGVYIHAYNKRDLKVKAIPENKRNVWYITPDWESALNYCLDLPDFTPDAAGSD